MPAEVAAAVGQLEAGIERRMASGSWKLDRFDEAIMSCVPVENSRHSVLASLLLDGEEVVGVISMAFGDDRVPGPDRRELAQSFLRLVSGQLSVVGELAANKARLGQLSMFYQVAQSMASTFDLTQVLEDTMELASAVLDAGASALMLVDETSGELVFEYARGELGDLLRKQRMPLDEGIAGWVATHGEPVVANDAASDPRFSPLVDARTGFTTRSVVCVPLQIHGRTIGVLEALNKRGLQGFDAEDLSLMITTANQAAIAVENARLYESVRKERDRIIQAQEDVRRQVARNLHDGTVQFLSAILLEIDQMERLLESGSEGPRTELEMLRGLARQAAQQARLALFELRPLILETRGLVPALQAYVSQLEGEDFVMHFEPPAGPLPQVEPSTARTIFAIVQEAINNARKHAGPHDVWLRLSCPGGYLQVVVEDNGQGFDVDSTIRDYDRRGSIGVLNMRERAELIDGTLDITSCTQAPTAGTCVTLRVPLARCLDA
jgi:signal transduction histidine kinase